MDPSFFDHPLGCTTYGALINPALRNWPLRWERWWNHLTKLSQTFPPKHIWDDSGIIHGMIDYSYHIIIEHGIDSEMIIWWVVWLPFSIFPEILGYVIIPIDVHIFQRGGLKYVNRQSPDVPPYLPVIWRFPTSHRGTRSHHPFHFIDGICHDQPLWIPPYIASPPSAPRKNAMDFAWELAFQAGDPREADGWERQATPHSWVTVQAYLDQAPGRHPGGMKTALFSGGWRVDLVLL